MENTKTDCSTYRCDGVVAPPPSFGGCVKMAAAQLDLGAFGKIDHEFVNAIVRVMADVYMISPQNTIEIEGERKFAGQVQEIYRMIGTRDVQGVIERTRKMPKERIINVKKYLRVALYNSVICGGVEDEIDAELWSREDF